MSKDNLLGKQFGPYPIWFNALLLLDAFVLGGCSCGGSFLAYWKARWLGQAVRKR